MYLHCYVTVGDGTPTWSFYVGKICELLSNQVREAELYARNLTPINQELPPGHTAVVPLVMFYSRGYEDNVCTMHTHTS